MLRLIYTLILVLVPLLGYTQEEHDVVVTQSATYIDLRIKSISRYDARLKREQCRILKQLKRKEKQFARKLKQTDTAVYKKYLNDPVSYDSISKFAAADTGYNILMASHGRNKQFDSLSAINSFIAQQSTTRENMPQTTTIKVNELRGKVNFRQQISKLTTERTSCLENISKLCRGDCGMQGIRKRIYYANSRIKVFKEMQDDPSKAEEAAIEYLQGVKEFTEHLKNATTGNTGGGISKANATQLEAMGYQTKRLIQGELVNKMAGGASVASGHLGSSIKNWQHTQNELISNVKETKGSVKNAAETTKPAFRINPMRGLPFRKRLEVQYSFNTQRADEKTPAVAEPAALLGFKHSERLTYGLGAGLPIGFGNGLQDLNISIEGINMRSFLRWALIYGFSAYGGYERAYNLVFFTKRNSWQEKNTGLLPHETPHYTESLLFGITKNYKINNKLNGSMQLLYDIWWQQKGLNTPIILRFATVKK